MNIMIVAIAGLVLGLASREKWAYRASIALFFGALVVLVPSRVELYAQNIDPDNDGSQYAQFRVIDTDGVGGEDQVNFDPSGGGVTVSASGTSGYAWSEALGWINTNPTGGDVDLTCVGDTGTFSGYWWASGSAAGGWVNLEPTGGGLTLSADGEFDGDVWVQNSGWITFDCGNPDSCVKTSYSCGTGTYECNDGIDNDGDGDIDYPDDSNCTSLTDDNEACTGSCGGGRKQCEDNRDNDGDGLVDEDDPACHSDFDATNTNSYTPKKDTEKAQCNDGDDNDNDTFIDENDPGCHTDGNAGNASSYDPNDNAEGTISCSVIFDPQNCDICSLYPLTPGCTAYQCSDGIDNDGDGKIDFPADPGCDGTDDNNELALCLENPTHPSCVVTYQCSDNVDNDGDGDTDYPEDSGCDSDTDNDESLPLCIEFPNHPSCDVCGQNPTHPSCTETYQCSDGIDNDGDGNIDYPNDAGCDGTSDDNESLPLCIEFSNHPSCETGEPTTSQQIYTRVKDTITTLGDTSLPVISQIIALAGLTTTLPGFGVRFMNAVLGFLGYRRKRRPWGVVYDSVTKQPLDPAYVTLFDQQGNEIASAITDLDGRYSFLANPGVYTIKAGKTNYGFPSKVLVGQKEDELYNNLYFGGPIKVERTGQLLIHNIPMDPIGTNWNEEEKKKKDLFKFFTRADIVTSRIINILFGIGFVFSLVALIVSPSVFNGVVVGLYALIILIDLFGLTPTTPGAVRRMDGSPLQNAIVRVWDSRLQHEIAHRVVDEKGQYYILVSKGNYRLTIEERKQNGSYTRVYTSPEIYARRGVINESVQV